MKNKLRFCLFPLLFCFCVSSKSNEDNLPTMEFSIIDSLLQKPVMDKELGISFRPPKNLDTLKSDSLVKKLNDLIAEKSTRQERRYIYSDSLFTFFFVLTKSVSFDVKNGVMALKNIEENYRKKYPQSEINAGIFKKDALRVHQIVVNLGKIVLVTLFLDSEKRPVIEANFILPADSYQEKMKSVESVIGAIQPIEKRL